MGAWGSGPLENDYAADLACAWQDFLVPALERCSPENTGHLVDRFIFTVYLRDINHDDEVQNAEVIALSALSLKHGVPVSSKLKEHLELAVYAALRPSELGAWENPKERKKVLLELLKSAGGRVLKKTDLPKSTEHQEETRDLEEFVRHLKVFCGLINPKEVADVRFDYEFYEQFKLETLKIVKGALLNGMRNPGDGLSDEAYRLVSLRMIALAYWLGCQPSMTPEDHYRFCLDAKKKSARLSQWVAMAGAS